MQITSIEQLQAIKQTEIVELPSFEDGTPFVVLGHASVLYLQYRGFHWTTQQVQTVFHKL